MRKIYRNNTGFTLLETLVSVSIFVILVILVTTCYIIAQQTYNKSSNLAELSQNARVSLDRISRELRQSLNIITNLPPDDSDPLNPPSEQILFQDGHDTDKITYIRYYLNGTELMRENKAYYFTADPATYVYYNSLDTNGQPPIEVILEDRVVGEFFSELKFWGAGDIINISPSLAKNTNTFSIQTKISIRN